MGNLKFLSLIVALLLLQSCVKENANELIVDPFTYGSRISWREDSIKMGNGAWEKIEKGNLFAWLADNPLLDSALQTPNVFSIYDNSSNLKTNFIYVIEKDAVFVTGLTSSAIYFQDEDGDQRTDISGQISLSPDTSLILRNIGIVPEVSIKYKLEK
jgi:hypothetical protein